MTNSTVPLNLNQNVSTVNTANLEIIEEIYMSSIDGSEIKSPKIRTTIIEANKDQEGYLNIEVDLRKLEQQITFFKLNEEK